MSSTPRDPHGSQDVPVSKCIQETTRELQKISDIPYGGAGRAMGLSYRYLLLIISHSLLEDDVTKLIQWAQSQFGIEEEPNTYEIFVKLDERNIISIVDLSVLEKFFEDITRIDIVCLIEAYLLGEYEKLSAYAKLRRAKKKEQMVLFLTSSPARSSLLSSSLNRGTSTTAAIQRTVSNPPENRVSTSESGTTLSSSGSATGSTSTGTLVPTDSITNRRFTFGSTNSKSLFDFSATNRGFRFGSTANNGDPFGPTIGTTDSGTIPKSTGGMGSTTLSGSSANKETPSESTVVTQGTGLSDSEKENSRPEASPTVSQYPFGDLRGLILSPSTNKKTKTSENTEIPNKGIHKPFKQYKPLIVSDDPKKVTNYPHILDRIIPVAYTNMKTGKRLGWLCNHYDRLCYVKADCCGKIYPCHRCHNNKDTCTKKKMKSRDVTRVVCTRCDLEQDRAGFCSGCGLKFADFFCEKCCHITGVKEFPYHCETCGICRINGDRSFHCNVCGICLDIQLKNNHKCRKGGENDKCCICLEGTFTGCQILPCSHKVHKDCSTKMIRSGITRCPICRESFAHKLERRPKKKNFSHNNGQ